MSFGHQKNTDVVKALAAAGLTDAMGGPKLQSVVAYTAAHTIDPANEPSGSILTNEGAVGSVTFTLPAATPLLRGVFYDIVLVEAQDVVLSGVTVGPASLTGGAIRVVCLGDKWWSFAFMYTGA
jgi:hypothetical protein